MKYITALFTLTTLGILAIPSHAATLSVLPDRSTYTVNDTVRLSIDGTSFAETADGVGVTVSWDPTILTYSGIAFANPPWDTTFVNNSNVTNGILDTVLAGSTSGAADNFQLAEITFTALSIGSTDVLIGTSGGGCVPGACGVFSGGTTILTDFNPANVNVVPIPAAIWLFGTGLVGLLGMRRKNSSAS
jgi:hypothetical protein